MAITVLCFASIREQLGAAEIAVDCPSPATVSSLINSLKQTYPNVSPHFDIARVAVNQEFVELSHLLNDGDEVAIISPVSGG